MNATTDKLVFALISRGNMSVLAEYSAYTGNFQQISVDVLRRLNLNRQYAQFGTANYIFYSLVREGFVFMVMAGSDYQMRIAINFLRDMADKFFDRYNKAKRDTAADHSLKDFEGIMADRMKLFNNPSQVDNFVKLQRKMSEVEQLSLQNLDKAIDRGVQIEVLVQKTGDMADSSYDLMRTATKVKNKMWWKNKKIMIAIIMLVLLVIFVIVWICCGISFGSC